MHPEALVPPEDAHGGTVLATTLRPEVCTDAEVLQAYQEQHITLGRVCKLCSHHYTVEYEQRRLDQYAVGAAATAAPSTKTENRPAVDHRRILNGMLWILRTGAPWRDLPERYGPWRTVASRFYRWQRAGIWERILASVQAQADAEGQLNWEVHSVDGTIIRAHQHAAGAKKGLQRPKP